jgi:hypothetical protein
MYPEKIMRAPFAYNLKGAIAAVVLSCFIAGGVSAMTSSAATQTQQSNSINRTNKGDRLPSTVTSRTPTKLMPLGCDSVFSPIVDPTRAHVYKRCIV